MVIYKIFSFCSNNGICFPDARQRFTTPLLFTSCPTVSIPQVTEVAGAAIEVHVPPVHLAYDFDESEILI